MRRFAAATALLALVGCAHPRSENVDVAVTAPPPVAPVFNAPDDAPRILRAWINETTMHEGDLVRGRVEATSNVASVEIRVESLGRSLPRPRYGLFVGEFRVPPVPAFLHRRYTLQILARNAAGRIDRAYVPIELR